MKGFVSSRFATKKRGRAVLIWTFGRGEGVIEVEMVDRGAACAPAQV